MNDDAVAALTQPLAGRFERPSPEVVREYWSRSGRTAEPIGVVHARVRRGSERVDAVLSVRGGVPQLLFTADPGAQDLVRSWMNNARPMKWNGSGWGSGRLSIDVSTVLLGLALDYQGVDDIGISPQRLGRAIHESSRRDEVLAAFDAVARDPAADEYNRLMAAIALHNAHHYAGTELAREGLARTAITWLETVPAD